STTSTCSSTSTTTFAPPSPSSNAISTNIRPRKQKASKRLLLCPSAQPHRSARRVAKPPKPVVHPSPKFSAIRQTALYHAKIHTVLIWQQLQSEFGPA